MHPNYLFIVGAPKCGTTSLAAQLALHPQVAVARNKEPRYFTDFASRAWCGPGSDIFVRTMAATRDEYEDQFSHVPDATWRVDASTGYLSCPVSAELIRGFADEIAPARVVVAALLRDPVERIVSEYLHRQRDELDVEPISKALKDEIVRHEAGYQPLYWHCYRSRYSEQIPRYRSSFGRSFLILDYHHFSAAVRTIWDAIGLTEPDDDIGRENSTFAPRSHRLGKLLRSKIAIRTARAVVPKRYRQTIRQTIETLNRKAHPVSARDIQDLRAILSDEIAACLEDPDIDTSSWRMSDETIGGGSRIGASLPNA